MGKWTILILRELHDKKDNMNGVRFTADSSMLFF